MAHVKPAYKSYSTPKVVSRGSVSKPTPLPRQWSPKREANDRLRRVKQDGAPHNF